VGSARRVVTALLSGALVLGTLSLVATPAQASLPACGGAAQNGLAITPSHDTTFYADLGGGFDAAYLSYIVANSGAARSNLWITVGSFTGGSVSLADPTDDRQQIASLPVSGSATRFFLAKATILTASAQTHTVTVYDRRPDLTGATSLATCTFTFGAVIDAQQANANKVTVITTSTSNPILGDTVTVTVTGGTGQANGAMWVSPASSSTWPSKALRLESTLIEVDKTGDGTYEESYSGSLFVPAAIASNYTSSTKYRTTYVFRATKALPSDITVKPVAEISSGGLFKHTGSYPSLPVISTSGSTSPVTVTKTVPTSPGALAALPQTASPNGVPGATTYVEVPYRLRATSASGTALVDEFADVPAAGVIFKNASATVTDTTRTAVALPDPATSTLDSGVRTGALHFIGPFTASVATPAQVDYVMYVPVTTGSYRNTAFATLGDTTVGASATTIPFASVTTDGTGVTGTTSGSTGMGTTAQTITFPALSGAAYGGAPQTAAATATSGLAVSYATTTPSVCSVSGAVITPLAAGQCTVSASQGGDATYAAATPVSRTFTVARVSQTITFAQPADLGLAAGTAGLSASSTSGLAVSLASSTAGVCTVSGSKVTLLALGTCTIDADQAGDADYLAAPQVIRSFQVTGATSSPQVITFAALSDTILSAPAQTADASATSGLPVTLSTSTPAVCSVSGTTVAALGVGTCTILADQAGNSVWDPAPQVSRSFTVSRDPQTIDFPLVPDAVVTDGSATLGATADSGLTVAYTSQTPGVCTVAGTTVSFVAVGTCTIDADQAGDASYAAATTATRSFAVNKATQSITFDALADQGRLDGPQSMSATSNSGLTVSFSSQTPSVCTVSGTTVTVVGVGTCTVAADQAGDATYSAAPTATRSFTVSKAAQTIDFTQPADAAVTDGAVGLVASADSGGALDFTSSTPTVCTVSGATVTLLTVGTCTIDADQVGDADFAPAPTVTRSFDVTPAVVVPVSQTITFDALGDLTLLDGSQPLSATSDSGLSVSFGSQTPLMCTVSGTTVSVIGTGTCTVDADQAGDAGHDPATTVTRSFTVSKAPQTIVFANPADTQLGSSPVTLVGGADSLLPVTFTSSTPAVCTVSAGHVTLIAEGTCTVQADQAGDGTYAAATPVTRSFTVTPAPVAPPAPPAPPTRTPPAADPIAVAVGVGGGGGGGGAVTVSPLPAGARTLPVSCEVTAGAAATGCTVTLYATVDGHRVVVGTGTVSDPTGAGSTLPVVVTLTAAGRRLVARPGGVVVHVHADISVVGSPTAHRSVTTTRLVTRHQLVPRPVFFATSSSVLRQHARAYLVRLRHRLAGVGVVTCVGYTDGRGAPSQNHTLGMRRAVAVCAVLTRGLDVTVRLVTRGENRPFASNATRHGRQLNRRTGIRLTW
jgi:outer membrane protein OmpA-like peptidoglycan-associated protein